MTEARVFNVLFLCTHNSARSIMAEGLMNDLGRGHFRGFSAGSMPAAAPSPFALQALAQLGIATGGFRSKRWEEFAAAGAVAMDLVITVCDNAAGETCPFWPGQPITAHWGVEDPSLCHGSDVDKRNKFGQVAGILKRRIELLVDLPLGMLERHVVKTKVRDIGRV